MLNLQFLNTHGQQHSVPSLHSTSCSLEHIPSKTKMTFKERKEMQYLSMFLTFYLKANTAAL